MNQDWFYLDRVTNPDSECMLCHKGIARQAATLCPRCLDIMGGSPYISRIARGDTGLAVRKPCREPSLSALRNPDRKPLAYERVWRA